jgi:hypothetical protein
MLTSQKQCQKISLDPWKQFSLGEDLTYNFWILAACPKNQLTQNIF